MDHKLVTVLWKDSATYREWYEYDELDSLVLKDKNIESTGYLVRENDEWIVLAQNIDDTSCSGITKIPKCSIISTPFHGKVKA